MKKLKKCPKCSIEKKLNEFCKDKNRRDKLNVYCRSCNKEMCKEYRIQNIDKIKEYYYNNKDKLKKYNKEHRVAYSHKYYQKNKEKINKYNMTYYYNNLDKSRKFRRSWYANNKSNVSIKRKEKLRNNPMIGLSVSISSAIWRSLKGNKNGMHWEDIVGYTLQDLISHLESQFTKGMTWNNHKHDG